jgi:microsomal dipeptidase-like Zn-dependent dipeptidase
MAISPEAVKIMSAINKRLGTDSVVIGSDIRGELIPKLTTGSTTFDFILGGGSPPINGTS